MNAVLKSVPNPEHGTLTDAEARVSGLRADALNALRLDAVALEKKARLLARSCGDPRIVLKAEDVARYAKRAATVALPPGQAQVTQ